MIEQCEADPNIGDRYGSNALHYAALNNKKNTKVIELLLTNMSLNSINKKDRYGDTPLDDAYNNNSPIEQKIIDLIRSKGGKRRDELAAERLDEASDAKTLLTLYKEVYPKGTPIVCACQHGRLKDVKLLITGRNNDVNGINGNNNNSPLFFFYYDRTTHHRLSSSSSTTTTPSPKRSSPLRR